MALILSLETATDVCSVALHEEGKLVIDFSIFLQKAHSSSLAGLTEQALKFAKKNKQDLNAVAISKGPGSYTGLRIGTSLAKGLCFGLNIPLIGINTLVGLARQLKDIYPEAILCPMLDARRMEVYYLLKDKEFKTVHETSNLILDENSFSEILQKQQICFIGNGARKFKDMLIAQPNAIFASEVQASAKSIGELAAERYQDNDFEDLAYFEPFYLKEFIAGKPKKLV